VGDALERSDAVGFALIGDVDVDLGGARTPTDREDREDRE
jgi:hypothetical protein